VTVQLPMFNECQVARRIIEAACAIDYPADRLQIQVLDDSTDESARIAQRACERMAARGHDMAYCHREDRTGFKAGALEAAMASATGELIAIFDADFIPPPDILRRTVHHFTDPAVGMVQTRWEHLNRDGSALTRCQATYLDSHFLIEHAARNRSGRWMNFNGTAGLWRRSAIDDAGGWEHDTLTEDVDLSYRAQLAGWRFVYLPRVACPAELPPDIHAYKSQQHRWTKGSVQCAIKLLPRIFRSPAPWPMKLEAFMHLTSPIVYVCMVVIMLLFFPALFVNVGPLEPGSEMGFHYGVGLFGLTTVSAATYLVASQRLRRRSFRAALVELPMLMAVGLGMALTNSRAVIEFVRTPKYHATGNDGSWRAAARSVRLPARRTVIAGELLMAVYLTACCVLAVTTEHGLVGLPFLLLFAGGYWYIGLTSLLRPRPASGSAPTPALDAQAAGV
jgi:cellulose synthase/poly-beta-1,6-N-acetylglucosamine synthase-like glycosyltransferase